MSCCLLNNTDTIVPTKIIKSIKIRYLSKPEEVVVPLATFETPLFYSVCRGAKVAKNCDGISVVVSQDIMTRSVILRCKNCDDAFVVSECLMKDKDVKNAIENGSQYAKFVDISSEVVGDLLYVRISIESGEASGHNMVTKAAQNFVNFVIEKYCCECISVSGNMCVDKKVSAINSICGRGKRVNAELVVPREICAQLLRTTPEKICELNTTKNLIGSNLAGSIMSANAHFANMLLAVYLATGQDSANIVEGSQGITYAKLQNDGSLYFSIYLPNVIVGTVGNGKYLEFARKNLEKMGCMTDGGSRRLSAIIGATVLCGELSLMAALTNNGELIKSHLIIERDKNARYRY